jgi:hypothetical protein
MPDSIRLTDGGVVFTEQTFGGLDTAEMRVERDEFGKYELSVDIKGTVCLDDFIKTVDFGGMELDFSAFRTNNVGIVEVDSDGNDEVVAELGNLSEAEVHEHSTGTTRW